MTFSNVHSLALILVISWACQDPRLVIAPSPAWAPEIQQNGDFYLPPGWEISLWAESPQLYNPTNMDVDTRGRLWVTEAVNYRDFNNDPKLQFEKGDRVMILEDTNGDGICDSSKIYVQDKDLQAPLGIAVIGNQVIVSCAPHLIVYTDDNGDDVPDHKEILLTGFGGFDHDHSLHALIGGPDGKWYFNTGNAGPHVVQDKAGWNLRSGSIYRGGTPYNTYNEPSMISDDGRIWVGGLALRMNSDGTGLGVVAHNFRNAYELTVDSYGDIWQNDNDDEVEACRTTWIMEGANAGFFSADGSRTWKADQRPNQETFQAHWHQDDPGVLPAGDRTGAGSPTGIVRYEGDAFGPQNRGMLLSADAGRNVIFGYQPKMKGAGYQLDRYNLISSLEESTEDYVWNDLDQDTRKWFRPSDVCAGTDGAIYIADWYDPIVGGHQMKDSIGYGRIYRVFPSGKSLPAPTIDLNTVEGQIQALKSPAINVRIQGFEKLKNGGKALIPQLASVLQSPNPFHRARMVWLLAQLGPSGIDEVKKVFRRAEDPSLRVAAYRALNTAGSWDPGLAKEAASDPSPAVRREAALALREVPFKNCREVVELIFKKFDHQDPYYLEALGLGLSGKESDVFNYLLKHESADPLSWSPKFKRLIWRLHPPEAVPALQSLAEANELPLAQRIEFVTALGFINETEAVQAMFELSAKSDSVASLAQWWLNFRRTNDWHALWDWPPALDQSDLPKHLNDWQTTLMNDQAGMKARSQAALSLLEDVRGARVLLTLISEDRLPSELNNVVAKPLLEHANLNIRSMAVEFIDRGKDSGFSIQEILKLNGNSSSGKTVFKSKCSNCHQVGSEGLALGPNLSRIGAKFDRSTMLDAIINPSASVAFGYQQTLIKTRDGQVYNGFELARNKGSVIIRDLSGQQRSIPLESISSEQTLQSSLMPDPRYLELDEQSLADLTTYLLTLK